jgi:uncharacterized cupin superfamily protein
MADGARRDRAPPKDCYLAAPGGAWRQQLIAPTRTELVTAYLSLGRIKGAMSRMSGSIVLSSPLAATLQQSPITREWILADEPRASSTLLSQSKNGNSYVMVWECTAGHFRWHYTEDETVIILTGEVFITTKDGVERRLGPGDTGFFPAGSTCTWRIPDRVRKVAVLQKPIPRPVYLALRVYYKILARLRPPPL